MNPRRMALVGVIVGVVGVLAAVGMGVAYVNKSTGGPKATSDRFVVEPADSVGPDAFTPSVVVNHSPTTCDKAKFVRELQARPDALREWARVLGLAQDQVPAYVQTLQPMVLSSDTKVTNHGLRNGQAYPVQSLLKSGTAVLVDPNFPTMGPPSVPGASTTSGATTTSRAGTTTSGTATTVPGVSTPVTKCKCGNPLLPPYSSGGPPSTTTPTSTSPTTTRPTTTTRPPTTSAPPTSAPPTSAPPTSAPPTSGSPMTIG